MLALEQLSAPAWPGGWAILLLIAALIAGGILLLWGRTVGRAALMLAAAAGAFCWAWDYVQTHPDYSMAVKFAATAGAAIAALVMARLIWALLAAASFSLLAGSLVLRQGFSGLWNDVWPQVESLLANQSTLPQAQADLQKSFATFDQPLSLLWIVTGVVSVLTLVAGLLRPRLMVILMTSLLGAAAMVTGMVALATQVKPTTWNAAWLHPWIPLSLVSVGAALGMIYQYRSASAAEKKAKQAADKDKPAAGEKSKS